MRWARLPVEPVLFASDLVVVLRRTSVRTAPGLIVPTLACGGSFGTGLQLCGEDSEAAVQL